MVSLFPEALLQSRLLFATSRELLLQWHRRGERARGERRGLRQGAASALGVGDRAGGRHPRMAGQRAERDGVPQREPHGRAPHPRARPGLPRVGGERRGRLDVGACARAARPGGPIF